MGVNLRVVEASRFDICAGKGGPLVRRDHTASAMAFIDSRS
jgi:hypothetical protein